jgi:mono/diheme cytochrome c family protein
MKKIVRVLGMLLALVIVAAAAGVIYIKTALPNVGEAPQITIQKTPARIERGKYLANHVTICMDCHSSRDWNLYSGPLMEGNFGGGGEVFGRELGFPGVYYARNITPYGIGQWTDGEVFRAITTGVSRDGSPLFSVMPYHGYGQLDQEDIYSIVSYLRTLQAVKHDIPAPEKDFPVNILINTMPSKANLQTKPAETDVLGSGKYLVRAGGCVECHSMREKGNIVAGTEFGGGMEFALPSGLVRSANITPDKKTGIGLWSQEAFVKKFKMYADSAYMPHKVGLKEMNTTMPWMMYADMKESDLKAIFTYLQSLAPITHAVVKFEPK